MINPRDVVSAARAVDGATSHLQPVLAEKLANTLPEIFGPAGSSLIRTYLKDGHGLSYLSELSAPGKSAAQVFAKAPNEGEMLGAVAAKYQENLAAFGLGPSTPPSELFRIAKKSGLEAKFSGGIAKQHHHFAGDETIAMGDHEIVKLVGAGRSGRTETTVFQSRDNMAGIVEHYSNFLGSKRNDIAFFTPHLRMEVELQRQLKALAG